MGKRLTPEQRDRIVEMLAEGHTYESIRNETGVCSKTVSNTKKEYKKAINRRKGAHIRNVVTRVSAISTSEPIAPINHLEPEIIRAHKKVAADFDQEISRLRKENQELRSVLKSCL
jgi:transposase-like protein